MKKWQGYGLEATPSPSFAISTQDTEHTVSGSPKRNGLKIDTRAEDDGYWDDEESVGLTDDETQLQICIQMSKTRAALTLMRSSTKTLC